MPLLRLVMIGAGGEFDPYRADLPSYQTISTDEVTGTIKVFVTSRNAPPQMPAIGAPYWAIESGQNVLIGMPYEMLMAWWQQLLVKYPDQFPPFQPAFPQP